MSAWFCNYQLHFPITKTEHNLLSLELQYISVNFNFVTKIAKIRILFILLMAALKLDQKWARSQHQVDFFHKNRPLLYLLKYVVLIVNAKGKFLLNPWLIHVAFKQWKLSSKFLKKALNIFYDAIFSVLKLLHRIDWANWIS